MNGPVQRALSGTKPSCPEWISVRGAFLYFGRVKIGLIPFVSKVHYIVQ